MNFITVFKFSQFVGPFQQVSSEPSGLICAISIRESVLRAQKKELHLNYRFAEYIVQFLGYGLGSMINDLHVFKGHWTLPTYFLTQDEDLQCFLLPDIGRIFDFH